MTAEQQERVARELNLPGYKASSDTYFGISAFRPDDPRWWGPLLVALMERGWIPAWDDEEEHFMMTHFDASKDTRGHDTLPAAVNAAALVEIGEMP